MFVPENDASIIHELRLNYLYFRTSRWTPIVIFIRVHKPDGYRQRSSEGIWNASIVRNEEDCASRVHIGFRRNAPINHSIRRTHV